MLAHYNISENRSFVFFFYNEMSTLAPVDSLVIGVNVFMLCSIVVIIFFNSTLWLVLHFSGVNFDGSTVGMAGVGTMCSLDDSCGVSMVMRPFSLFFLLYNTNFSTTKTIYFAERAARSRRVPLWCFLNA